MLIPCPKCSHPSVDIYQDTAPGARSWPGNAVVHCRICGHRLYGPVAIQYTKSQVALIEKQDLQLQEELASKEAVESARVARRREKDREYRKRKKSRGGLPKPYVVKLCAYTSCSNNNRPKSKYCSDSCRKKNARDNRKLRRQQKAS